MSSRKFYTMDHLKPQPQGIKNTVLMGRILSLGSRFLAWMPSLAAVRMVAEILKTPKCCQTRKLTPAFPERIPTTGVKQRHAENDTNEVGVLGTLPYQRLLDAQTSDFLHYLFPASPYQRLSDVQMSGFHHCLLPVMFPLQLLEILESKRNWIYWCLIYPPLGLKYWYWHPKP